MRDGANQETVEVWEKESQALLKDKSIIYNYGIILRKYDIFKIS